MSDTELKKQVESYWDHEPCGTTHSAGVRFSRDYFDAIENYRYTVEPEIFSFAQFSRFHGKKVLEVGVGAGTDFLQWIRSGANGFGIDLTHNGIVHTRERLNVYGFDANRLMVADAETLPFQDGSFDLVYSWGVIHHSPDTVRALTEIIRVTRPGGGCKIMVYNRHSLWTFFLWGKMAFLKGRPWKSLAWSLYHYQESPGTKAYTAKELATMVASIPGVKFKINSWITVYDSLDLVRSKRLRALGRLMAKILGDKFGWYMTVDISKS
ncbi:MAG: class I SAM-dependent methyltransferase [Pseudomonadota bacterium]